MGLGSSYLGFQQRSNVENGRQRNSDLLTNTVLSKVSCKKLVRSTEGSAEYFFRLGRNVGVNFVPRMVSG